LFIADQTR